MILILGGENLGAKKKIKMSLLGGIGKSVWM